MNVRFFENKILAWYQKNGRNHLPWRNKGITAYQVWVSEVMLQQTQVGRVVEYYERFLQRFPRIEDLAVVRWEQFLPFYAGLGYYNRARNMLKTAEVVVEKYGGQFPKNKAELLQLPGIGEYTAHAILSFAYDQDVLAPDTNVKKVLARFFVGSRDAFAQVSPTILVKLKAKKKDLNAALMDFSNLVCKKNPLCSDCPLQKQCRYFQTQGGLEKSLIRQSQTFPVRQATAWVFLHRDHQEYFSQYKTKCTPFILSPTHNSREEIKKYFLEQYNLEVAVRPPHRKLFVDGQPIMMVNAQILRGQNPFFVFDKAKVHDFLTPET